MPAGLTPLGFLTFLDANGNPLVGGSVAYFDLSAPGNLKPIWADPQQLVPINNPVPLDAAGRPTSGGSEVGIWGTGDYRMIVRDASGVLQWSALTTTPLGTADLNALQAQLTTETNARIAADNAEATTRASADTTLQGNINSEATTRANADAAEAAARAAADASLQGQINALVPGAGPAAPLLIGGEGLTDGSGHVRISFPTPFSTALTAFVGIPLAVAPIAVTVGATADLTGADVFVTEAATAAGIPANFYWMALGH